MNIKTLKTQNGMDKICITLPVDINYGEHTEAVTFYADVPKGEADEIAKQIEEYLNNLY